MFNSAFGRYQHSLQSITSFDVQLNSRYRKNSVPSDAEIRIRPSQMGNYFFYLDCWLEHPKLNQWLSFRCTARPSADRLSLNHIRTIRQCPVRFFNCTPLQNIVNTKQKYVPLKIKLEHYVRESLTFALRGGDFLELLSKWSYYTLFRMCNIFQWSPGEVIVRTND